MIVVVEGISASGKTTWCRQNGAQFLVPENGPIDTAPDPACDPAGAAAFWTERNAERWYGALAMEARLGTALCDGDPLKLHYRWALWKIGQASRQEWEAEKEAARRAIERRSLGFPDHIFFIEIDERAARIRKQADLSRSRRNFDLHVRLQPTLILWYRAMAAARPGTVSFGLPAGLPETGSGLERYDIAAFDVMMGLLH
jgi:hypothetical protein